MLTLSSHWILVIFSFVLNGHSDYLGFDYDSQSKSALSPNNYNVI